MLIDVNNNQLYWMVRTWWFSSPKLKPSLKMFVWTSQQNLFVNVNVMYRLNPSSQPKLIKLWAVQGYSFKAWLLDHRRFFSIDMWYLDSNWSFIVDNDWAYWYRNPRSWDDWSVNYDYSFQFLAPSVMPATWKYMCIRITQAWWLWNDIQYIKIYLY